ncbi:hypothetical protein G7Y89_g13277 [Cudoniella acicularis]|uniref:2EXR domain-containing protein n=1 Tax=Cudoniella acicularis TaxID=354080 RepID=A0A8H4R8K7_9HELO|nr:hypothetical protein G7Y89_g13277 [Cudoniella acicularis]
MADSENGPVFSKFSDLPLEIRLMIWEEALPGPRLVEISQKALKFTIGQWNEKVEKDILATGLRYGWGQYKLAYRMRDGTLVPKHEMDSIRNQTPITAEQLEELRASVGTSSDPSHFTSIQHRTRTVNTGFGDMIISFLREGIHVVDVQNLLGLSSVTELQAFIRITSGETYDTSLAGIEEDDTFHTILEMPMLGIGSNQEPPAILFACKESHRFASRFYRKAFTTDVGIPETFFDFQRDTFYIRFNSFSCDAVGFENILQTAMNIVDTKNVENVENLAILLDPDAIGPGSYEEVDLAEWLTCLFGTFTGLKTLSLVLEHYCDEDEDSIIAPVTLIPPIDVEDTCHKYRVYLAAPDDRKMELEKPARMDYEWAKFDEVKLKACLEVEIRRGQKSGKIPKIEYKVGITEAYVWEVIDTFACVTDKKKLRKIENLAILLDSTDHCVAIHIYLLHTRLRSRSPYFHALKKIHFSAEHQIAGNPNTMAELEAGGFMRFGELPVQTTVGKWYRTIGPGKGAKDCGDCDNCQICADLDGYLSQEKNGYREVERLLGIPAGLDINWMVRGYRARYKNALNPRYPVSIPKLLMPSIQSQYSSPPNLLLACRESYSVACKAHEKAFSTYAESGQVYFDFRRDTSLLNYHSLSSIFEDNPETIFATLLCVNDFASVKKVENLAVSIDPRYPADEGPDRRLARLDWRPTLLLWCHQRKIIDVDNLKPEQYFLDDEWSENDQVALDTYHAEHGISWPMPQIDCKIAVTAGFLASVDKLETRCDDISEEIARHLRMDLIDYDSSMDNDRERDTAGDTTGKGNRNNGMKVTILLKFKHV